MINNYDSVAGDHRTEPYGDRDEMIIPQRW